MVALLDTLMTTLKGYTGEMLNGYAYLATSDDHSLFTVVAVGIVKGQRIVETSLIVRLVGGKIVIEYDDNNKPLVDALVQAGISRDEIILAYAGEPVVEAV